MDDHRVILGVMVLLAIVGVLALGKPSITGYVPTEIFSQGLEIDVRASQRFILHAETGGPLHLASLSLSGRVEGQGLVNVYLSDGAKEWLVFSNQKKGSSAMEQVTGLATLQVERGVALDRIEALPDGYTTRAGVFSAECVETCVMDEDWFNRDELYLDVVLEPGTVLHVEEIQFSVTE